jgi:hypothetical protein
MNKLLQIKAKPSSVVRAGFLQRKCVCGGTAGPSGECAACREKKLQRRFGNQPAASSRVPPLVHEVLRSPGQRLDAASRAFMEPRFGRSFGDVRVHAGPRAADSARAVNALAYTVGNHIVFGKGQDAPKSTSGKRILAHELAHVVQQRSGNTLQGYGISHPGDSLEREASRVEEAIMSGKGLPTLSAATNTLQRQVGDPFNDPFGEGAKPKQDPTAAKAIPGCGSPCGSFPWVEVAPDHVFSLCHDRVKMFPPDIQPEGCSPGGQGNLIFSAGSPAAWAMPEKCSACVVERNGHAPKSPPGLQVGYIQTAEKVLSGGVYFQRNASGKWDWAGNDWLCVATARDGHPGSTPPWYGPDVNGNSKPEPFGTCPLMADSPLVKLKARKAGASLRRMRIDGIFHTWLIAQAPNRPVVFIHHWNIQGWVVAELNDDADPCNVSGWRKMNMNQVLSSGPGQGSATPVLTGKTANELKKPC